MVKQITSTSKTAGPKPKRQYNRVTDAKRSELLAKIEEGVNLYRAAKQCGVKFQNARLILRVYKKEGRPYGIPLNLRRLVGEFRKNPEKVRKRLANCPERLSQILRVTSIQSPGLPFAAES